MAGPHTGGYRDVLIDGFVPPSTSVAPMFPFFESTSEWDDFGEVINPDDYVIKDEDMGQAAMHVSFHIEYLPLAPTLTFMLSVGICYCRWVVIWMESLMKPLLV